MVRLTWHDLEVVAQRVHALEDTGIVVNSFAVGGFLVTISCADSQRDGLTYYVTGITSARSVAGDNYDTTEARPLTIGDTVTMVPHVGVVTEVGPANAVVCLASGILLTVGLTEGLVRHGAS